METPFVISVQKNNSIPWFEQIKKTVLLPYRMEKQTFYSIKPPDYVTVLARTTENKFIVLKQYRPAVEDYTFELPSGHIEAGEMPSEAMMRELREETRCKVHRVTLLGEIIPDTGRLENRLWAFYSRDIEMNRIPEPRENEGIEVRLVTWSELLEMIKTGKLNHALDLSVITLAIFQNHVKL
jgi:ADP-ribose pyrophosphatase